MNNIIKKIILLCFFVVTNSNAQEGFEVSLADSNNYQAGVYYRDLNGELTPYLGTWEGTLNNKKYTFVLQKFVKHMSEPYPNGYYSYSDEIKVKFSVTDLATNTVLYSSLSATAYEEFPIFGVLPHNGIFDFVFRDTVANCRNTLEFTLKNIPGQTNQLKYCYFRYDEMWKYPWETCDYINRADIPVYLPKEDLILTKL